MIKFYGLFDDKDHIITDQKGVFSVVEHMRDKTVSAADAIDEFYMSQMNVRKKQILATLNGGVGVSTQVGAMQWMAGDIRATTGIKSTGDFFGKLLKSAVTDESAVKPEYQGNGYLMLEPTYKYLLLEDVANWEGGLVLDDGLFLACESTVSQKLEARRNVSSAVFGKMGFFNLKLAGKGICALESNVSKDQLILVELENDVLKIDGNFAICRSGSLNFSVEKSSKSLLGSAVSGEGLVNVYRGTGKVLLSPLDNKEENTGSLQQARPVEKKSNFTVNLS